MLAQSILVSLWHLTPAVAIVATGIMLGALIVRVERDPRWRHFWGGILVVLILALVVVVPLMLLPAATP